MIPNRKNKTAGLIALLLSGLLFLGWIGSQAAANLDSLSTQINTGRIPYKTRILLARLQQDLKTIHSIQSANSARLLYRDETGHAHEFSFMYGALWQDEYPFILDVKDFHFEFRDSRGNLLNANSNPAEIITVGYVLHLEDQGREFIANLSVRLSQKNRDWTEHTRMVAAVMKLD